MTRPTTDEIRRHLKLATKSALYAAGGAAGIVAQKMTRVGEAALSFYASLGDDHCHRSVPLDVALDLDFVAGEPIHARALANAQGYRLVPMFEEKPSGQFALADVARIAHDYGEVQACCFEALEDGAIDVAERLAILERLSDLDRCTAQMRAKLQASC
ncbi:hypothetical protein [Aurantimonas phage AmM-1]|uniref:CII-like transcriptional activator n=1 Tax=Aurantimonas phage AmM-1 TaxID=1503929 RepID=UPI000540D2A9|nr:CII-like transcriptional activator [Aurantimonas phage AmM-1]BAP94517.1 hypothetical protein [Aurantimonas phage AmM-1]